MASLVDPMPPDRPPVPVCRRTALLMDTLVTIQVVGAPAAEAGAAAERALGWFRRVEAACSRFDPASEAMGLTGRAGEPVPVSDLLYEVIAFALAVARASGGAFDPTIGHILEQRGFNRNYQTGAVVAAPVDPGARPSWRDVELDPARRTVTLRRPLVLDLGAVAKGLAVDLAMRELQGFPGASVDAGGDIAVRGHNAAGEPWCIGVRHPRRPDALLAALRLTGAAICTSGDYERASPRAAGEHHLIDPRHPGARTTSASASATVIAPTAMAADALATAAFVLGPRHGLRLLEREGAEGLLVTPALELVATAGFRRYLA